MTLPPYSPASKIGGDLGLDASQIRAFLLYQMAQQIPSFLTVDSETPHTYMVDERGIFVLLMADVMFKGGLFPLRNRESERPWALVDALNDFSTRRGPRSGAAREDIAFSVILGHDRQYGFQRWGEIWQEHNEAISTTRTYNEIFSNESAGPDFDSSGEGENSCIQKEKKAESLPFTEPAYFWNQR